MILCRRLAKKILVLLLVFTNLPSAASESKFDSPKFRIRECENTLKRQDVENKIALLRSEGVMVQYSPEAPKAIVASPEGTHRLNRIAHYLHANYDGLKLVLLTNLTDGLAFYQSRDESALGLKGPFWEIDESEYSYQTYDHSINFSLAGRFGITLSLPLFEHELRHASIGQRRIREELNPVFFTRGEILLSEGSILNGLSADFIRPLSLEEFVVSSGDLILTAEAILEMNLDDQSIDVAAAILKQALEDPSTGNRLALKTSRTPRNQMNLAELFNDLNSSTRYFGDISYPLHRALLGAELSQLPKTIHKFGGINTTWYELATEIPKIGSVNMHIVFSGEDINIHEQHRLLILTQIQNAAKVALRASHLTTKIMVDPEKSTADKRYWINQIMNEIRIHIADPESKLLLN